METPPYQPPRGPDGSPTMPLEYQRPEITLPFRNRKTPLLIWGIVICIVGGIVALSGLLSPLAIFAIKDPEARRTLLIALLGAAVTNIFNGAGIFWLGIGLCMTRKWARSVGAALAGWMSYAMAVGLVAYLVNIPNILARTNSTPAETSGVIGGAAGILIALGASLALFRFLRRDNTRSTVHFFDPIARWTDAYNEGVLFVLLLSALSAIESVPGAIVTLVLKGTARPNETALAIAPHILSVVGFGLGALFTWRKNVIGLYLTAATMVVVSIVNLLVAHVAPAVGEQTQQLANMRSMLVVTGVLVSFASLFGAFKLRWYFTSAAPQGEFAPELDSSPPPMPMGQMS